MLKFTLQLGQLEHEIKRIQQKKQKRERRIRHREGAERSTAKDNDDASRKITFKAKNTLTKHKTKNKKWEQEQQQKRPT